MGTETMTPAPAGWAPPRDPPGNGPVAAADWPPPGRITHLDLPHSDDVPVDNISQPEQRALLTDAILAHLARVKPDGQYEILQDTGVYWRLADPPLSGCKAPDWAYIPDVPRLLNGQMRRSFVMWNERAVPLVMMEFVSGDGREERDDTPGTGKFWVYRRGITAPYYVIHDPFRETLDVYRLRDRDYILMPPDRNGRFLIPDLGVTVGQWVGPYHGRTMSWLRFFTPDGAILPTSEELAAAQTSRAEAEKTRAEAEKTRANAEKSRADALQALLDKLKAQETDPDSL